MKKLILSLFLFFSFSSLAHAQWTTSGTVTSTTNVIGIGTTTPDEKLVVNGAIKTILDPTPNFSNKNVARILALGGSGITGAQNWAIRGVYQYPNGVGLNSVGGDLDLIKSWNANTILGTKPDGTPLGYVGIGTLTPNTRLDVNGVISMNSFGYLSSLRMPANNFTNLFLGGAIKDNADGTYSVYTDGGSNYFSAIKMDNGGNNAGAINFYDGISVSGSNYNITNANLANYLRMTISGNGNVGVGIATPQNKLDVNGTIHSKAVNIDLNGWSDYVFEKDYQLKPLSEVKTYIDQNQHLPEIPSEQELMKKGLDVGEMNKLLMKKVEELTLYLIEKDKEVREQRTDIDKLKEQVQSLLKKTK